MGKITDYGKVSELTSSNMFIIDGGGTKTIMASELYFAMLDAFSTVEQRRMNFRGKNLGTSITEAQKASIRDGSFKGFFVGDYWLINGINWRIVDFDYWYNRGLTALLNHHLVIMPDVILGPQVAMNLLPTTEGGYVGSQLYTSEMPIRRATVESIFGDSLLTHGETLGVGSGQDWTDSTVDIPNMIMMFGSRVIQCKENKATVSESSYTQLSLFKVAPRFIHFRSNRQWLRDVITDRDFVVIGTGGYALTFSASNTGVEFAPFLLLADKLLKL